MQSVAFDRIVKSDPKALTSYIFISPFFSHGLQKTLCIVTLAKTTWLFRKKYFENIFIFYWTSTCLVNLTDIWENANRSRIIFDIFDIFYVQLRYLLFLVHSEILKNKLN